MNGESKDVAECRLKMLHVTIRECFGVKAERLHVCGGGVRCSCININALH